MEKDEEAIKVTDKYFFQYVVAFSGIFTLISKSDMINFLCVAIGQIASLLSFSVNVAYGWTSPALPFLTNPEISPIPITNDEGSWIVAIYVIGTIVGIIDHCVIDRFFIVLLLFSNDTCGVFDGKVSSRFYIYVGKEVKKV